MGFEDSLGTNALFKEFALCKLTLMEKWGRTEDNADLLGTLLKNLSKIFDYLRHEGIIAKLVMMYLAWVFQHCSSHLINRK